MSARAKSKIVFRIATSSARAASWALRSPSAFASDWAWRPSATFCSAARACSTASAYSPRSKCPSALSRSETASPRLMPASWPSWIFLPAGDVDVRLPEVLDEFLDHDELRRRAARLLESAPLLLLVSLPAALRDPPLELRERLEYGGGPGVVHGGLHRREDRGQVPGGHAFLRRVVGEP